MAMNQQISNPVCACGNTFARTKSIANYGQRRTYFMCHKCGARLVIKCDMDGREICRYEPRAATGQRGTSCKRCAGNAGMHMATGAVGFAITRLCRDGLR